MPGNNEGGLYLFRKFAVLLLFAGFYGCLFVYRLVVMAVDGLGVFSMVFGLKRKLKIHFSAHF